MKKVHKIWLDEFLKNCEDSNKSPHTLINYKTDLVGFIRWYEKKYSAPLNKANAQTISEYISFMSNPEKSEKILKKLQPKKKKKIISSIKGLFKGIFKSKSKSDKISDSIPEHLLLPENDPNSEVSKRKAKPAGFAIYSLAVASRRRHLSAIKNFFEYLKQANEDENKLFQINPVKSKLHNIKLKDSDVEPTKLMTEEDFKEVEKIAQAPREKFIIYTLYYGGLRLSELTELKIDNFNREKKSLTFTRKGGYVHTLFIQHPNVIFEYLDDHLTTRIYQGDYVFTGRRGKPLTSKAIYNIIMNLFKKASCPTMGLTPHSFRKACATNLYNKTKDLLYVRDYLNHSDAKVTQTYIEMTEQSQAHRNKKGY